MSPCLSCANYLEHFIWNKMIIVALWVPASGNDKMLCSNSLIEFWYIIKYILYSIDTFIKNKKYITLSQLFAVSLTVLFCMVLYYIRSQSPPSQSFTPHTTSARPPALWSTIRALTDRQCSSFLPQVIRLLNTQGLEWEHTLIHIHTHSNTLQYLFLNLQLSL